MNNDIRFELKKNNDITMDEINQKFQLIVDKYNNEGLEQFEGLSPANMYDLLYTPLDNKIIHINPNNFDGNDIPIIVQIKYFISIINESKEIKLTKAGNLPPTIVKDIYNKKFIIDKFIELGITKLSKETDVENIVMMRIICTLAGLIRKQRNKIILCKNTLK